MCLDREVVVYLLLQKKENMSLLKQSWREERRLGEANDS